MWKPGGCKLKVILNGCSHGEWYQILHPNRWFSPHFGEDCSMVNFLIGAFGILTFVCVFLMPFLFPPWGNHWFWTCFFSPDCPRVYLNMGYIGISVKWQFSWGERQGRGPQIKCNTAIFRGIVMIKHFGFRVTIFSNTLILLFFTILRKW